MNKPADKKSDFSESILSGRLEDQGVADIIQFLEIAKHTGHFLIDFKGREGRIDIKQGQIVSVSFGSLRGMDAFYSLVALESGAFHFITKTDIHVTDPIKKRNYALILEALKQVDEKGRDTLIAKALNQETEPGIETGITEPVETDRSATDGPGQIKEKSGLDDYLASKKLNAAPEPDEQSKRLDKMAQFLKDKK